MYMIYLWNDERNGWQADFRDTPEAELIRELFGGSTVLPTDYTSNATFEHVVSGLRQVPANANARFVEEAQCVCIPNEVTLGQDMLVIQKYAADNPAVLHESASIHVAKALTQAFPCKAKSTR